MQALEPPPTGGDGEVILSPLLQEGMGEVTLDLILLIISQFMGVGNFSY